jgi:WD40 repeat protein
VITDHLNNIVAACRLPDSEDVVLGCSSGRVHLFDTATGRLKAIRQEGGTPIAGLSATGERGTVLICWSDGTAQIWEHGELLESTELTDDETVTDVVSPDLTAWIATGAERGSITVIDRASSHRTALIGHSSCVRALAASSDGDWLASGSDDGTVCLWDPAGTSGEQSSLKDQTGPVRSLSVAGDRVFGVHGHRLAWWDARTGELTERQDHATAARSLIGSLRATDRAGRETAMSLYLLKGQYRIQLDPEERPTNPQMPGCQHGAGRRGTARGLIVSAGTKQ